jgi:hypothetical protein
VKATFNSLRSASVKTQYSPSTGLPTSVVTTFLPSWERNLYAVGPLIKGNFKDPNPWKYQIQELTQLSGFCWYWSRSNPKSATRYDGIIQTDVSNSAPPYYDVASEVASAQNGAISRLNEKVRGSLDLAVSLAEAGQAVKMLNLVARFKSGVRDMVRSYQRELKRKLRETRGRQGLSGAELRQWQRGLAARHRGLYHPVRLNRALVSRTSGLGANGWCEYTYGWKPLISDIRGVAENVVNHVRNNDVVSASYKRKLNRRTAVLIPIDTNYKFAGEDLQTGFVTIKYKIKLVPGWDESLAKWTSLNPISVLYELTPYSFVYDWFQDMGSYMRGLETALLYGNKFKSGYTSNLSRLEVKRSSKPGLQAVRGSTDDGMMSANSTNTYTWFSRDLLSSYPTPTIPSFEVDLGANQLISAAALLRQLLR